MWTLLFQQFPTFHSNQWTALKTVIWSRRRSGKMCFPVFLSLLLSLTINLLTHDYVSHTFVFLLVQTCTSTWALHSKLQSTRLSLCDSRDTVWAQSSFMHSLNRVLFEILRWKPEIADNIHSPQERSKNCLSLTRSIWLPMVYLILQVNTVVKLLQGIVSGIKLRTQAWSALKGDFEGAI